MTGLRRFLRRWSLFIGAVALWETGTRLADDTFFPPPSTILGTAVEIWLTGPATQLFLTETVFEDILPSLRRVLGGWLISVVLGVGLGTVLGRSRNGMDYVGPLFAFARAIPPPTLIRLFEVSRDGVVGW